MASPGVRWADVAGRPLFWDRVVTNQTTTSNVLGNVTLMVFPILANEIWSFEMYLQNGCDGVGGINWALDIPASATLRATVVGMAAAITAITSSVITADATATAEAYNNVNSAVGWTRISGACVNSSTVGTVQLQYRSVTNLQTSTIFANSYFVARRH